MSSSKRILYVLNPGKSEIFTCDEDGENINIIDKDVDQFPDGIYIDAASETIYFTRMGKGDIVKEGTAYGFDGSIWKMGVDGSGLTRLTEPGQTRTPKQITADIPAGKLYWCDREGMRVMRCNLDGSGLETLVQTGVMPNDEQAQSHWCVGVAIDPENKLIYWTQKGDSDAGNGSIRRAGLDIPAGETAVNRSDIEILFDLLPEPIDLDLDKERGYLYWTDRGDRLGGNSVCRATINDDGTLSRGHDVLVEGTGETIGLTFDHNSGKMFITAINGDLFRADIDGGIPERIGKFEALTGISIL